MAPKILVVDDEDEVRQLICLTLDKGHCEVHEAPDGETGWQKVRAIRPHLVVLDVAMPGSIDGLTVCQRIKQDPDLAETQVLVLTASRDVADIDRARDVGADAYWIKPFTPVELLDQVDALLPCGVRLT